MFVDYDEDSGGEDDGEEDTSGSARKQFRT